MPKHSSNCYYHFRCVLPGMPKSPKITSLLFLCNILIWFFDADKHESLLQSDSMILMVMVKHSQSSQNSKFAMSLQYLRKEVKVDFLHSDKHQSFLKVYFNTLGISTLSYKADIIIINGYDQAFSSYLK